MPEKCDSELIRKLAYSKAVELWCHWKEFIDKHGPSEVSQAELDKWSYICTEIANWTF